MRPMQQMVVAGNGRTTIACLNKLLATPRRYEITIFGAERYCAYDRAALPAYLAGDRSLESLFFQGLDWYQDRGIGSEMLRTGIKWLQGLGVRTLGLETMPRTIENIGFYSRLGFETVATTDLSLRVIEDTRRK